jgi:hypothetical protein
MARSNLSVYQDAHVRHLEIAPSRGGWVAHFSVIKPEGAPFLALLARSGAFPLTEIHSRRQKRNTSQITSRDL